MILRSDEDTLHYEYQKRKRWGCQKIDRIDLLILHHRLLFITCIDDHLGDFILSIDLPHDTDLYTKDRSKVQDIR